MRNKGYFIREDENGLIIFFVVSIRKRKKIHCGTAYVDADDNIKHINVSYKPKKGMSVNEKLECFKEWAIDNTLKMESPEIHIKIEVLNKNNMRYEKKYIPIDSFSQCDFKC